jgi:hypothetical protein
MPNHFIMIMVFTESLDGCNEIILYFNRLMNMLSKQKNERYKRFALYRFEVLSGNFSRVHRQCFLCPK